MGHRIFKGIVPKTNCKNIDLDQVKQYNALFAIHHLADDGTDPRFASSCVGFANSNFENLFSNWYVIEDKSQMRGQDPVKLIINVLMKRLFTNFFLF